VVRKTKILHFHGKKAQERMICWMSQDFGLPIPPNPATHTVVWSWTELTVFWCWRAHHKNHEEQCKCLWLKRILLK